jgi:mannose-6-phosphate isomerase-like protein (cupin superfamily)
MKTTDRIVEKPWGGERIFAANGRYAGKLISIRAGETLSFQYHRLKEETIHVLEGTLGMETELEGNRVLLSLDPGETFHVSPGTRHRMFATGGDVLIVEVSSPELDDVVRLEDRYGREGTSQP